MADQAALQEAIQRARQLAAKISQNAPVKRAASELDDSHTIGTVKVTLAYEKPANSDRNRDSHHHPSSGHRDQSSSRDRDRDRDGRDSTYLGSNGNLGGGGGSYPRGSGTVSGQPQTYPPPQHQQPPSMLSGPNYAQSGTSNPNEEKIELIIPHAVIGLVIGKGGENIKRIQNESCATVRVDPNTVDEQGNKMCTITGTKMAVDEAHRQVLSVIENSTNKRPRMQSDVGGGGGGGGSAGSGAAGIAGGEQYRMKIPAQRTGAIIGKGGETIKSIKQQSGCDIELDKHAQECGPDESVFIIRGSSDRIAKARALIEARLASRGRDGDRAPKGVATGANAAPVAQFTDLPASYPQPAGQPNPSADMSAAWAAYFAQYSNLLNQAGPQPGAAAPAAMPYGAGQNPLGAVPTTQHHHHHHQLPTQPQQVPQATDAQHQQALAQPPQPGDSSQQGSSQQDYSDQWIEFYLMNGRPDYAKQIMEMKEQQQAQKQQQQQQSQQH